MYVLFAKHAPLLSKSNFEKLYFLSHNLSKHFLWGTTFEICSIQRINKKNNHRNGKKLSNSWKILVTDSKIPLEILTSSPGSNI